MSNAEKKSIANLEEIQPRIPSYWEDLPLLLFTLIAQLAVGGFWAMLWMFPNLWTPVEPRPGLGQLLPLVLVGLCLGTGALSSLTHLGTKKRALFALQNIRRSWLSREVLFLGCFGAGWLFATLENAISGRSSLEAMALTATLGLGLIYSMAQVYRLRTVPAWNTWRTTAGFFVSALLLGQAGMIVLRSWQSYINGSSFALGQPVIATSMILMLLLLQFIVMRKPTSPDRLHRLRTGLIVAAIMLVLPDFLTSALFNPWISLVLFVLVVLEEISGRRAFYQARTSAIR